MKTRRLMLALLALVLSAGVAGASYAACESSDRLNHNNAECLHAWWDNNDWPEDSTFAARNECPAWGTVVAKVDIRDATDRTWHLNDGNTRRGSTSTTVREISCCEDLSDLCDKADMVSTESCKAQFELSTASSDCIHDSDPTPDDSFCVFDLTCTYVAEDDTTSEYSSTYGLAYIWADDILFCTDTTGYRPRHWMSTVSC